MRIGLIGANGLIGTYVRELLNRDRTGHYSVLTWDQRELGSFLDHRSRSAFLRARLDLVIHCAWVPTSRNHYRHDPTNYQWLEATLAFASECSKSGIHLTLLGSGLDAGQESSPYSRAKSELRNVIKLDFPSFTFVRPQYVFSVMDLRPRLLRDLLLGDLTVIKNPQARHDFIDVADVAHGIVLAAEGMVPGESYLGSGVTHTVLEFAHRARGTGRTPLATCQPLDDSIKSVELQLRGWRPRNTLSFFQCQ